MKMMIVSLCLLGPDVEAALMKDKTVPELIRDLGSANDDVQREAGQKLVALGAKDEQVIDLLLKAMATADRNLRIGLTSVCGRIGPTAHKAIPALARIMQNKEELPFLRELACNSLALIGPKALPVLIETLRSD